MMVATFKKVYLKSGTNSKHPNMDVKQHNIGLQDFTKTFVGTTVLTVWRGKYTCRNYTQFHGSLVNSVYQYLVRATV